MEHKAPYYTESLETCIRHRHSKRFYKNQDVDRQILLECLALAHLSPSNSNIQNWRIHFATGKARARVIGALQAAAAEHEPDIPLLPQQYRHFRSELGQLLYSEKGYNIAHEDKEGRDAAAARNFEFFGAPVGAVITMHKDLIPGDAMSVGMFVQTFVLALTARGLGACLQGSVAGYPEVLRREFRLEDDQVILCGMSLGWPAEQCPVNNLVTSREELDTVATFHDD